MIIYFVNEKLWQSFGAPDNDVHDALNNYPNIGDLLYDAENNLIYICDQTGFESQVWSLLKPPRIQSPASRSLDSAFQIDATRDSLVNYSVDIEAEVSLTSGQTGTIFLEIASDSGFTTDVQELGRFVNGNTGTLAIGLSLVQSITANLSGYVPPGFYVRLRTENTVGTPTFTYRSGQEVLL